MHCIDFNAFNLVSFNLKISQAVKKIRFNLLFLEIGKHVAELVEDGATLQMGIGNIPNVVLSNLNNHKRLGISKYFQMEYFL